MCVCVCVPAWLFALFVFGCFRPDAQGWTPLHSAASSGKVHVLSLLLAAAEAENPSAADMVRLLLVVSVASTLLHHPACNARAHTCALGHYR